MIMMFIFHLEEESLITSCGTQIDNHNVVMLPKKGKVNRGRF